VEFGVFHFDQGLFRMVVDLFGCCSLKEVLDVVIRESEPRFVACGGKS
jgi:hypothetical protein